MGAGAEPMDPAASASSDVRGPAVLLVGGLLTSPLMYRPLCGTFRDRGVTRFSVARVGLDDWLMAACCGAEASTSIVADAIEALHAEDGRRLLVIAHSGGGLLARLALSRTPFGNARRARPESVAAVVTLGTPHLATHFDGILGREGLRALRFLADQAAKPGIPEPWTLLTIGGELPGYSGALAPLRRRFTAACYRALLGAEGNGVLGDGLVPRRCAVMPEGKHLVLKGIAHAPFLEWPWYFSKEAMDLWWGPAVAAWRGDASETAAGPAEQPDLQSRP